MTRDEYLESYRRLLARALVAWRTYEYPGAKREAAKRVEHLSERVTYFLEKGNVR